MHVRDSNRNDSLPHRRPIHKTNWEDGYIEEEDASVTLTSDTRMTALVSLDLRLLSPGWGDAMSAGSDVESLLDVTFSGGDGLLVRFLQTDVFSLFKCFLQCLCSHGGKVQKDDHNIRNTRLRQ